MPAIALQPLRSARGERVATFFNDSREGPRGEFRSTKCVVRVRAAVATPDGPIEDALNRAIPNRGFQPTTDGLTLRLIGAPNDAADVDVTISGVDMKIPKNILAIPPLDAFRNATGGRWSPKTMRVDEVTVRLWAGGEVCAGETTPTASVSEMVSGR